MIPFCNPFDEALASHPGAPAVFLLDREGMLRFDETWTRDAWGRDPGPHAWGIVWRLLRDRATGYVTLVMTTSPTLNATHPRCDVRSYASWEDATAARAALGPLPMSVEPWEAA